MRVTLFPGIEMISRIVLIADLFILSLNFYSHGFHLYYTDRRHNLNNNYINYVYSFAQITYYYSRENRQSRFILYNAWPIIPYCVRSLQTMFVDDDASLCAGQLIKFENLRHSMITTNDLFDWNAPIDTMNLYQQYLESNRSLELSSLTYCNCSDRLYFGQNCQYTFHFYAPFSSIIEHRFASKDTWKLDNTIISTVTCYNGLPSCRSLICLDWREICDGKIDCIENGEDEQNCYQLEMNQCDPIREFRCKNGMCIDKNFAFDLMFDCLDRTDEQHALQSAHDLRLPCYNTPSIECEESLCQRMWFTCGDGDCLHSYGHSTECYNGRYQLKKELVFDDDYEWKSDISLMYPNAHILYKNGDGTTFICYNNTKCRLNLSHVSSNDDIYCENIDKFSLSMNSRDFRTGESLLNRMEFFFSACALSQIITHSSLFHCENTHKYISKDRIRDNIKDCLFGSDELTISGDFCMLSNDPFQCLGGNDCVPRKNLFDINVPNENRYHCKDKSDTMLPFQCMFQDDIGCWYLQNKFIPINDIFLYQEICNGVPHPYIIDDEKDCDEWQKICSSKYTAKCDGINQCVYGRDEQDCESICPTEEEEIYCLSNIGLNKRCLKKAFINDGNYDCYGGLDEDPSYCKNQYPRDLSKRFRCWNSSECIRIEQLCDGIKNCLHNDDEEICSQRSKNNCSDGTYFCAGKCQNKDIRCNGVIDCSLQQCVKWPGQVAYGCVSAFSEEYDEWFCDLITKYPPYKQFSFHEYNQYPPLSITNILENQNKKISSNLDQIARTPKFSTKDIDLYYCHRGVLVSHINNGSNVCLCPPNYEGDRCQYQREHITVHLKIKTPMEMQRTHIFRVIVHLETKIHLFYDLFDFLHVPYIHNASYKHIFYLISPHLNESLALNVVINVFYVTGNTVEYHSTWHYGIQFALILPVNRLTAQLNLDPKYLNALNCNEYCVHGVCSLSPDTRNQSFCLCNEGWTGDKCDITSSLACAPGSFAFHSYCVCPLGRFGYNCYGKVDLCRSNICQNNATCRTLDIKSNQYICICAEGYYGKYCQNSSAKVNIVFNKLIYDHSIFDIPVVLIHFVNIVDMISLTTIQDRFLFKRVSFNRNLTIISHQPFLSTFIYVQIFFDAKDYYGQYYLVSFSKQSVKAVYTSILMSNECPFIGQFLSNEIMSYSYMKRIKSYYKPCLKLGTKCFYDEKYICLCDNEANFDCFLFDHSDSNCTDRQYCQNDGHCIQSMQKRHGYFEFACVCSECYYGDLCQFTTAHYTISLNSLLGQHIYPDQSLNDQSSAIKVTFAI
ncbi:unnamed protein product, partial [Rotaria sp. Silwood2]